MFIPPDPGPELLMVLTLLSAIVKIWWFGRTKNPIYLTEAGVRFALFVFYVLVTMATYSSDFGGIFTSDQWRIYARWGYVALFLIEIIPYVIIKIKQRAIKHG